MIAAEASLGLYPALVIIGLCAGGFSWHRHIEERRRRRMLARKRAAAALYWLGADDHQATKAVDDLLRSERRGFRGRRT